MLTHDDPEGSVFLVQDNGTTYRYVAGHRLPALPRPRTAANDLGVVR